MIIRIDTASNRDQVFLTGKPTKKTRTKEDSLHQAAALFHMMIHYLPDATTNAFLSIANTFLEHNKEDEMEKLKEFMTELAQASRGYIEDEDLSQLMDEEPAQETEEKPYRHDRPI